MAKSNGCKIHFWKEKGCRFCDKTADVDYVVSLLNDKCSCYSDVVQAICDVLLADRDRWKSRAESMLNVADYEIRKEIIEGRRP